MLAIGTPEEVRKHAARHGARVDTMEQAFIAIVEAARQQGKDAGVAA
jgi:hypothetical protein